VVRTMRNLEQIRGETVEGLSRKVRQFETGATET
jgi:hypothetical protein